LPRTHLALLVLAVAAFGLLAVTYDHEPVATVDRELAEWVAESLPQWVEALARPFSWIGGWIRLTALGIVAAVLLIRERAWLDLAFVAVAFIGSHVVVMPLFERAGFEIAVDSRPRRVVSLDLG
jgi:hypothetical protein